MPPKKKKGSPKKGKKGKGVSNPNAIDELSKQLYLVQIRDLDEKVNRRKEKSEFLEKSNEDFKKKLTELDQEKFNMTYKLRKDLESKTEEEVSLVKKLDDLQVFREESLKKSENELKIAKNGFDEEISEFQGENNKLKQEINSLELFKVNQENIEKENINLENLVNHTKRSHEIKISILKDKERNDNVRMERQMHSRMKSMADSFKIKTQNMLPETTKRLIHENNCANTTINKLDGRTDDLVQENKILREKYEMQKNKILELEKNEKTILLNNQSRARLIILMTERSEGLSYELDLTEKLLNDTRDYIYEIENDGEFRSKIINGMKRVRDEMNILEKKVQVLKNLYAENQRKLDNFVSVIDDSCLAIVDCLLRKNEKNQNLPEILTNMNELSSGSIKNLKIF